MKAHKNFGIASAIAMTFTVFTGMNSDRRKSHGCWACLTAVCLLGAIVTGRKMTAPKKVEES